MEARSSIFATTGNQDTHIILRGGTKPNYDAGSVAVATRALEEAGLQTRLMIDFSHANSLKRQAISALTNPLTRARFLTPAGAVRPSTAAYGRVCHSRRRS